MRAKEIFSQLVERDLLQGEKLFKLHATMKKLEIEKDNEVRKKLAKQIEELEKDIPDFKPEMVQNMFKDFKLKESKEEDIKNLKSKIIKLKHSWPITQDKEKKILELSNELKKLENSLKEEKLEFKCKKCSHRFSLEVTDRKKEYKCPNCGRVLKLRKLED